MENRDQFSALKFILRVKVNSKVEELSKKKKKKTENGTTENRAMYKQ